MAKHGNEAICICRVAEKERRIDKREDFHQPCRQLELGECVRRREKGPRSCRQLVEVPGVGLEWAYRDSSPGTLSTERKTKSRS